MMKNEPSEDKPGSSTDKMECPDSTIVHPNDDQSNSGCDPSQNSTKEPTQSETAPNGENEESPKQWFYCDECGKSLQSAVSMEMHKVYSCNKKRKHEFLCKVCGKKMRSKETVKVHMRTMHSDNQDKPSTYPCQLCDKVYKVKHRLTHHIHMIHSQKNFSCDLCNKGFADEQQVERHKAKVHTDREKVLCPKCGHEFATSHSMQRHLTTQHRRCKCLLCGQRFMTVEKGKEHMSSVHIGQEVPYSCTLCVDYTSEDRSEFENHMYTHIADMSDCLPTRNYMNQKPLKCLLCGRRVDWQTSEKHIRESHVPKEAPYKCLICQFSNDSKLYLYDDPEALVKHLTTHIAMIEHTSSLSAQQSPESVKDEEGFLPYKCLLCQKKMSDIKAGIAHMKSDHLPESTSSLYCCTICQSTDLKHPGKYEYTDAEKLVEHLLIHLVKVKPTSLPPEPIYVKQETKRVGAGRGRKPKVNTTKTAKIKTTNNKPGLKAKTQVKTKARMKSKLKEKTCAKRPAPKQVRRTTTKLYPNEDTKPQTEAPVEALPSEKDAVTPVIDENLEVKRKPVGRKRKGSTGVDAKQPKIVKTAKKGVRGAKVENINGDTEERTVNDEADTISETVKGAKVKKKLTKMEKGKVNDVPMQNTEIPDDAEQITGRSNTRKRGARKEQNDEYWQAECNGTDDLKVKVKVKRKSNQEGKPLEENNKIAPVKRVVKRGIKKGANKAKRGQRPVKKLKTLKIKIGAGEQKINNKIEEPQKKTVLSSKDMMDILEDVKNEDKMKKRKRNKKAKLDKLSDGESHKHVVIESVQVLPAEVKVPRGRKSKMEVSTHNLQENENDVVESNVSDMDEKASKGAAKKQNGQSNGIKVKLKIKFNKKITSKVALKKNISGKPAKCFPRQNKKKTPKQANKTPRRVGRPRGRPPAVKTLPAGKNKKAAVAMVVDESLEKKEIKRNPKIKTTDEVKREMKTAKPKENPVVLDEDFKEQKLKLSISPKKDDRLAKLIASVAKSLHVEVEIEEDEDQEKKMNSPQEVGKEKEVTDTVKEEKMVTGKETVKQDTSLSAEKTTKAVKDEGINREMVAESDTDRKESEPLRVKKRRNYTKTTRRNVAKIKQKEPVQDKPGEDQKPETETKKESIKLNDQVSDCPKQSAISNCDKENENEVISTEKIERAKDGETTVNGTGSVQVSQSDENLAAADSKDVIPNGAADSTTSNETGPEKVVDPDRNLEQKFRYKCEVCGRRYTQEYTYKRHIMCHAGENRYMCTICGASYNCPGTLEKHKRTHTGEKPYKCTICGRGFTQSTNRNRHMMTHTGIKPWKCPTCGKGFQQKIHVEAHLSSVHSVTSQYTCPVCKREFTRPDALKRHLRIHTGERPFACEHCPKTFGRRECLKTHLASYHKSAADVTEDKDKDNPTEKPSDESVPSEKKGKTPLSTVDESDITDKDKETDVKCNQSE